MTDIAVKANVSKVSIYNYYSDKAGLVEALVFDILNQQRQVLEGLLQEETHYETLFMRFLEKCDQMKEALFKRCSEGEGILVCDPYVKPYIDKYMLSHTIPLMEKLIVIGQEQDKLDASVAPNRLVKYLQAVLDGMHQGLSSEEKSSLRHLVYQGVKG